MLLEVKQFLLLQSRSPSGKRLLERLNRGHSTDVDKAPGPFMVCVTCFELYQVRLIPRQGAILF